MVDESWMHSFDPQLKQQLLNGTFQCHQGENITAP
jgi:hypothetical protein